MKSTLLFVFSIVLGLACMTQSTEAQQDCPTFCPEIFNPVCGYDGQEYRTFSNSCQLGVTNCKNGRYFREVKQGEC